MGDEISGGHFSRRTALDDAGFKEPFLAVPVECVKRCGDKIMNSMGNVMLKSIEDDSDFQRALVCEETKSFLGTCNLLELYFYDDGFASELSEEHFGVTNKYDIAAEASEQNGRLKFSQAAKIVPRTT